MLYDSVKCLYGMSTTDENGNELEVNVSSFSFSLLRNGKELYTMHNDTLMNLTIIPVLMSELKKIGLEEGDVLYFYNIKVRHFNGLIDKYCYHESLPLIRIVDNVKRYPRRMYMDVSTYLKNKQKK